VVESLVDGSSAGVSFEEGATDAERSFLGPITSTGSRALAGAALMEATPSMEGGKLGASTRITTGPRWLGDSESMRVAAGAGTLGALRSVPTGFIEGDALVTGGSSDGGSEG
jgi:hypothetical protein